MPSVLLEHTLSHPGEGGCQQPHATTAAAMRPPNDSTIRFRGGAIFTGPSLHTVACEARTLPPTFTGRT